MGKREHDATRSKGPEGGSWVKRDRKQSSAVQDGASYGTYKGQALPPPGREHIIVRTPNPLPAPKDVDSL